MGPVSFAWLLSPLASGRFKLKLGLGTLITVALVFGIVWYFGDAILVSVLKSKVRQTNGADLGVGKQDIGFIGGNATFDTVTLEKPGALKAAIPRMRIISGPWRHLFGSTEIEHCTIEGPVLSSTEEESKPPPRSAFRIADLTIKDGEITLTDPSRPEAFRTVSLSNLNVEHAVFDNLDRFSVLRTAERVEGELRLGGATGRVFIGQRDGVRTWAFDDADIRLLASYWPSVSKIPLSEGRAQITCRFAPAGSTTHVKLTSAVVDTKRFSGGLLGAFASAVASLLGGTFELSFPIDYDPGKVRGSIRDGLRELWAAMGRGMVAELGRKLGGKFGNILDSIK